MNFLLEGLLVACGLFSLYIVYKATFTLSPNKSIKILITFAGWLIFSGYASYINAFAYTNDSPILSALVILLPLVYVLVSPITEGKKFLKNISLYTVHQLQVLRIPIFFIFIALFYQEKSSLSPWTIAGGLELVVALSSTWITYFGYKKKALTRFWLLTWEFLALFSALYFYGLLLFTIEGLLIEYSAEPLVSIFVGFPYVWIVCFFYPLFIFGSALSLGKLITKKRRLKKKSSELSDQDISKSAEKIFARHKDHL
ncbi:MAG: hypothetical protein ACXITV_06605 [Luteibaculaceae bacterium]